MRWIHNITQPNIKEHCNQIVEDGVVNEHPYELNTTIFDNVVIFELDKHDNESEDDFDENSIEGK